MGKIRVAVIGLGYVGLPLARLFATLYPVVGFDVKRERVAKVTGESAGSDGTVKKQPVKKGQKVITGKYTGTEVKLDGEKYIIVRQSDILAIVE